MSKTVKKITAIDVLLYYPNIVGYVRVISMLASFCVSKISWELSILLYLVGFIGDVVDGYVARAFNQCAVIYSLIEYRYDRFKLT